MTDEDAFDIFDSPSELKSSWDQTPIQKDREEAQELVKEIDEILEEIKNGETSLATNYAKLGSKLLTIRTKKYWIALGFKSFNAYIESVKEKINHGRTQLYQFISVAEKLLPSVSEAALNQMGISKAIELQRVVTATGGQPPQELIDCALCSETTREYLRGKIFKHLHMKPDEPGTWFEFGGFYVTVEERAEIQQGLDVAARVDPIIPESWPAHSKRKEIMLRLVREFLSTYLDLVNKGEG
jgi:hypothetical protein